MTKSRAALIQVYQLLTYNNNRLSDSVMLTRNPECTWHFFCCLFLKLLIRIIIFYCSCFASNAELLHTSKKYFSPLNSCLFLFGTKNGVIRTQSFSRSSTSICLISMSMSSSLSLPSFWSDSRKFIYRTPLNPRQILKT